MDGLLTAAIAATPVPDSTLFLLPGMLHASRERSVITTVLGSCVSVCLASRTGEAGGMNHFLLPSGEGHAAPESARFGRPAVQLLLQRLAAFGTASRDLEAKVFGGSSIIGAAPGVPGDSLGTKNVAVALSLLDAAGIPVVASDVGGGRGRKLVFDTGDGAAWVRFL